ncbi:hypothetical protein B0T16DRAFT_387735 [Cercophora newfieldiana]|uniref:Uncharacterized protein n=1 Tax=Cercophora newfieldiana TaxID=92897 RepID=A0AA39YIB4_9PEZI|nr:hypothetical protein B0T16DRAFT_387735 [Cercophora newfieldiana]
MAPTSLSPFRRYTGPPPPGLTAPIDLAFWDAFVALDALIPEPPKHDEYLFSSGGTALTASLNILQRHLITHYGLTVTAWMDTYCFAHVNATHPPDSPQARLKTLIVTHMASAASPSHKGVSHLWIKCLSWAISRRAALAGGVVHVAMWKDMPLYGPGSFWGMEVGMLTGENSNVDVIVRHDMEELPGGQIAVDPPVVVWRRDKHKMLGVDFEGQDWSFDVDDLGPGAKTLWRAEMRDSAPSVEVKEKASTSRWWKLWKA